MSAGEVTRKVPSVDWSILTVLPSLKASLMASARCCRASGAICQKCMRFLLRFGGGCCE